MHVLGEENNNNIKFLIDRNLNGYPVTRTRVMSEYETGVPLHEGGGKDPNEILNERVRAYALARRGRLEPGDLHYEAVAAVPADGQVYKARRAWVAYALAAAAGAYDLGVTGLVALGMVLWVDLYGGLLHVVFDRPGHASHPVLGPSTVLHTCCNLKKLNMYIFS